MKVAYSRVLLCVVGLLMIGWAALPAMAGRVAAAPALVITATSTAEPPTLTPTTAVPTTAVPTTAVPTTAVPTTAVPTTAVPTVSTPTNTPVGPSATPTATPRDPDPAPDPSNTPQPSPTATSAGTPESTPAGTPESTPVGTPALTPTPSQFADPAITKSASRTELSVGDTVEFTLSVTNRGNVAATDVVVEDSLPSFLALDGVSASRGEVSVSGALVRVVIGTLEPGETVTVRITARVVALATPPNNANVGTVSTSSPTDDPSNNRSSVELTTQAPAASATPGAPAAGAPASLPNTGGPGGPGAAPLIALGLVLIAASLLIRPRRA